MAISLVVYWQYVMKRMDRHKQRESPRNGSHPLGGRVLCCVLALLLLPYGTVGASPVEQNVPDADSLLISTSAQVLSRLGVELPQRDALRVEEALLEGKDALEVASAALPNAVGSIENLGMERVGLLNQIPLGVRSRLFGELARGTGWDSMAEDILAQIPLALAATIVQENALNIAMSLPVTMTDFPWRELPTPYGETFPTDQALPSATVRAIKIESQTGNRYYLHGVAFYRTAIRALEIHGRTQETFLPRSRSIYSRLGLMPTGPPVGDRTLFLPNQNASFASAGSPYGR
jgi:hypothetical protein